MTEQVLDEKQQKVTSVLFKYLKQRKLSLEEVKKLSEKSSLKSEKTYMVHIWDENDKYALSGAISNLKTFSDDDENKTFYYAESETRRISLTSLLEQTYGDTWFIIIE